jgi:hypothetical protein
VATCWHAGGGVVLMEHHACNDRSPLRRAMPVKFTDLFYVSLSPFLAFCVFGRGWGVDRGCEGQARKRSRENEEKSSA